MSSNSTLPESPEPQRSDVSDVSSEVDSDAVPLELQFLHWSSLFFDVLAHGRQYIFPIGLAIFGTSSSSLYWVYLAIFFSSLSLLRTCFRYFTLRFGIRNGELVVSNGLFFRSVRTVPTRRVQNIDLRQNVLHRLFGVYEVHVETASGTEPEAVLRVLTKKQVDDLRAQVFSSRDVRPANEFLTPASPATITENEKKPGAEVESPPAESIPEVLILKIKNSWLIKAGFASNRGWVLVGVLVGVLFQFNFWENLDERSIRRIISDFLPDVPEGWGGLFTIIGIGLLIIVLLKLFGMAWYLTRFFGYRLTRNGEDLRVNCGLLTSYSATIPRGRIQFISIQNTWMMRWMGIAKICIETAGAGGGGEGENSQAAIMRSSFVPAVPVDKVTAILNELRPGLNWDEANVTWTLTSPHTFQRTLRLAILQSLIVSTVAMVAYWPWGALGGLIALPITIWWARKASTSRRYARTNFGVAYRSGLLTRKLSMTFFERLQTISFSQSPFDRRWKMANLEVDTAAAGPADHRIHIHYLDQLFAAQEFRDLQKAAATHVPTWK